MTTLLPQLSQISVLLPQLSSWFISEARSIIAPQYKQGLGLALQIVLWSPNSILSICSEQ